VQAGWIGVRTEGCDTTSHTSVVLLYYVYVMPNMFLAPLCSSSGAHDDSVEFTT